MENILSGLSVIAVISIVIGVLFGDAASNGFIQFVIGAFEGVINIFTAILSVLL